MKIYAATALCAIAVISAQRASAGGTYLTICNNASDRSLHIFHAVGKVSQGWWKGEGWYKADRGNCIRTGLFEDGVPVAFAFALPDDAGGIVPIEVSISTEYGRLPMSISQICVPEGLETFENRNSAAEQDCSEGAIAIPVSFTALTGRTALDQFVTYRIPVYPGSEVYDFSVEQASIAEPEETDHKLWQTYYDGCYAKLVDAPYFDEQRASKSCACYSLVIENTLEPSVLTYEWPVPWNSSADEEEIKDMSLTMAQCTKNNPLFSISDVAPGREVQARMGALAK